MATSDSDQISGSTLARRSHRLRQPGMPREVLRRPRLDDLYDSLFRRCTVLAVSAAPGAGKTVQAQLYAEAVALPVAWITLDAGHASPQRLLSGLVDAVREQRRDGADVTARPAMHLDATVEEAAALAAESLLPEPALLVVDECEHLELSEDAHRTLDTFLEYCPEQLRVLLLTRSDLSGPLQRRMLDGRIRLISDAELQLTSDENQQLAELLGEAPEKCGPVHEATGGWTAGAAFSYRYGLHAERLSNDLPSVIMQDLLSTLPDAEQQFLLDSSIPDIVTREIAVAMCGEEAHAYWEAVRIRHLPATTVTETTVVYHSLFQSFLRRQLLARDPQRHHELVRRYARYLIAHQHAEEATELYLSIDDLDQAQAAAERATDDVCARSDWDTFMNWADRLGEERLHQSPRLLAALVRSLFGQRRFDETIAAIRKLDREGRLRAAMEADPALLATAAWALQADPGEAGRLLARYEGDYRADVVRFMLKVCTDLGPATPPLGSDWGDVERIMSWGLLLQGRLSELRSFAPDDPGLAVVNPNVILAPVFSGDFAEARSLWNRVPKEIRDRPQSRFVESLLLIAEGETERAHDVMETAFNDSRRTTFFPAPAYETQLGYVLLQLGCHEDAITILQDGIARCAESGQMAMLEWGQAFLGMALLVEGQDDAARPILNECVRSMNRAHRRLMLPLAAACLSEAEASCGDQAAAHEAAELAYHTAALIGSFSSLLAALRSFPEIVTRQQERDPTDMRWRRLVVAPSARPNHRPSTEGHVRLELQPFGPDRDIWINGTPQRIGRIKLLELTALLTLHPEGIDRAKLQCLLFPDATLRNGGNHFRQISFKFRQITSLSLDRRDKNLVGLPPDTVVEATDLRFEQFLQTASWVTDEERVLRLRSALEGVTGPYLEGSNLSWAEERRNHLEIIQEEARLELVRLLLDLGHPDDARSECETLLTLNRYSDPAYRLLVQIERTIGSESSVQAAYRRAVLALDELGLEPGDARRLLKALPASPRRPRRQNARHERADQSRKPVVHS